MKMKYFALGLATLVLGLTGCQNVNSRIKEKPDVFAKLDLATQDKIKQGIIDLGFTEEMVYLALGDPDQKKESVSVTGQTVSWIYNTYYERFDGMSHLGYSRRVYFDPYLNTYRVHYHPAFGESYVTEKEERIRIVFKDGKVIVIEQTKA